MSSFTSRYCAQSLGRPSSSPFLKMAGRADSVMAQDFLTDVDAPALLGRLKEAAHTAAAFG